jgi:peptidoglycan/LPS O-acetylase OafA/YrhL
LRAISIMLVLASHVKGTQGFPGYPPWWWHAGDIGNLGVRIFFVISGFLITHLLLREEERQGRISLTRFYVRRAFRILPPLWVFLLTMLGARAAGLLTFPTTQWLQGALFSENYVTHGVWNLGHLWSLSVEEQFYLLWPAILLLAPRAYRIHVLGAGLLAGPVVRIALLWHTSHAGLPIDGAPPNGFFSSMDALAIGCLLAVVGHSATKGTLLEWLSRGPWTLILPALLLLLNGLPVSPWVALGVILPLLNLLAACLVGAASLRALAGWQPLLDSAVMRWLGRLSYSLYLWQQPFLDGHTAHWYTRFPVNILAALSMATLSYYVVERTALALRPSRADAAAPPTTQPAAA